MARANTDEAIRWLDHWHRKTRRDALRWRSQAGLRRMAAKRSACNQTDGHSCKGQSPGGPKFSTHSRKQSLSVLSFWSRCNAKLLLSFSLKKVPFPMKELIVVYLHGWLNSDY